jgi:hypothetical protein
MHPKKQAFPSVTPAKYQAVTDSSGTYGCIL